VSEPSATPSARPRVVLATRNQGKVRELQHILLEQVGLDVDLIRVDELPGVPEVEETGESFADNALLKARAVAEATGLPAIADDSGLCVDALGGDPGVRSARWAGEPSDDAANLALLLKQIDNVADGSARAAHFACAAAVVVPGVGERVVAGRIDGTLIRESRGTNGFGYDPVFVPLGENRTTAEMPPAEKDAISHRGRAFRALAPHLVEMLRRPA
jgi:XTP/dITP diphosphohydrolase